MKDKDYYNNVYELSKIYKLNYEWFKENFLNGKYTNKSKYTRLNRKEKIKHLFEND